MIHTLTIWTKHFSINSKIDVHEGYYILPIESGVRSYYHSFKDKMPKFLIDSGWITISQPEYKRMAHTQNKYFWVMVV